MMRAGIAIGLIALAGMLSACTVKPLYATDPATPGASSPASELASISVDPVDARVAQQVRNQLIFLFTGGAGEPANPRYTLTLSVVSRVAATTVEVSDDRTEATSAVVDLRARYVLKDAETGEEVASGSRKASAPFDVPRQEFAAVRAQRDAENRAAREAAELVHLAVAQDLSRIGVK